MSLCSQSLHEAWLGDLTTLCTLQLLSRYTNAEAAAICGVSVGTYRRWRTDRRPTLAAVRLLAVMAGYVPWRGWSGWEVHHGELYPPGGVWRPGHRPKSDPKYLPRSIIYEKGVE